MMRSSTHLDAALALAAKGYRVFPCSSDKTPLVKGWEQASSTEASVIHGWWQVWPDAVPGLPCGPNGLAVIDCDVKGGVNGIAGFECGCEASHVPLSLAFSVATPSGGKHFYYRADGQAIRNTVGKLGPGIDSRGDGGYVVAYSPSVPHPGALQPLPEAIAAALTAGKQQSQAALLAPDLTQVTDGDRSYGQAALLREYERLAATTSGRNHALNVAANALGEFIA